MMIFSARIFFGFICLILVVAAENECDTGNNDCDVNANCIDTDQGFDCECMNGYVGDGKTCEDIDECANPADNNCLTGQTCINTVGLFYCDWNPCPNIDCWDWDPETNNCKLNNDCASVSCGALGMTLRFKKDVLGTDAVQVDGSSVPVEDITNDALGMILICRLDKSTQCGTSYSIENNKLVFETEISIGDASALDDVTQLGDIEIETVSDKKSVIFKCSYDMELTVNSASYSVETVTIDGAEDGQGELTEGFTLNLSNPYGEKFILGDTMTVEALWKLSFDDVFFYFDQCQVEQADVEVALIENTCYSNAIGVDIVDSAKFNFRSFAIKGTTGNAQRMVCTIVICKGETCVGDAKTDAECTPNSPYDWQKP